MKDRIKLINYNGKQIVFIDFSSLSAKDGQFIKTIKEVTKIGVKMNIKDSLMLIDVGGSSLSANSSDVIEAFEEAASTLKKYAKKVAVIGATGEREFALKVVNDISGLNACPFASIDEAKSWLIQ